jgi:exodeoxyribonuclease V alpha subunit
LTQIFRQAQQSGIVVNAHRINHGQPPHLTGFGDFYWFTCEPPEESGLHPAEETANLVVDIVARRIPARFGLDPVRDVQVLTPVHRGPACDRQRPAGPWSGAKRDLCRGGSAQLPQYRRWL